MGSNSTNSIDDSWLSPRTRRPGERCLTAAYRMIFKLGPPFIIQLQEGSGLMRMGPLPFFLYDEQYIKKANQITPPDEEPHEQWVTKWNEIAKCLTPYPKRERIAAWRLLWRCDATTRRHISRANLIIEEFLRVFNSEEVRVGSLRQVATVIEAVNRSSLFPFEEANKLSAHGHSLIRFCDRTQEDLDRARSLVKKAEGHLAPAKRFYLGEHIPRLVKQALCDLLMTPAQDKKATASLIAKLLSSADPKRPVSADAIRQIYYGR